MSELLFNELPRPTFRWLRVNHTPASLWGESDKTTAVLVKGNDAIISPLPAGTALMNTNYKGANGEAVAKLVSEAEGYRIHVPAKAKEVVGIRIDASARIAGRFQFIVEEDAQVEVQFFLDGGTKEATNIQYLNEYDVKSNAKIVVKKVNLLDETVQHIEHRYTKLEDNADVEYINVEIGGKENFLNYEHDLQGESSKIVPYCLNKQYHEQFY